MNNQLNTKISYKDKKLQKNIKYLGHIKYKKKTFLTKLKHNIIDFFSFH